MLPSNQLATGQLVQSSTVMLFTDHQHLLEPAGVVRTDRPGTELIVRSPFC